MHATKSMAFREPDGITQLIATERFGTAVCRTARTKV